MCCSWAGSFHFCAASYFIATILIAASPGAEGCNCPGTCWSMLGPPVPCGLATTVLAGTLVLPALSTCIAHTGFFNPDLGSNAVGVFNTFSGSIPTRRFTQGFFRPLAGQWENSAVHARKPLFRLTPRWLYSILWIVFPRLDRLGSHHMFFTAFTPPGCACFTDCHGLSIRPYQRHSKFFNWLATLWAAKSHTEQRILFSCAFHRSLSFSGGITVVALAQPLRYSCLHDIPYFVAGPFSLHRSMAWNPSFVRV